MTTEFLVYCERLAPGLLAEPVNLFSNAGFLVAGLWALARWRYRAPGIRHLDIWLLSLLILATGVGSALWHSFHTGWAELLDKLPVLAFIHLYLFSFLWRIVGWGAVPALVATALFFAASKMFSSTVDPALLNGSVFYLPALLALAGLTAWCGVRGAPAARFLAIALAVFVVSLLFRTVDAGLCSHLPTGTHFMWHLLNAVVLGLLLYALADPRLEPVERIIDRAGRPVK